MKTKLFSVMLLMLAMWACSNEDLVINNNNVEPSETPRFYGVKQASSSDNTPTTRGVAQDFKLWNAKAHIRIKFLDGSAEYQEIVKSCASEWQEHISAQLTFVEPTEEADVRITFNSPTKYLTWSYTGTDCKFVRSQTEPTAAFFNWLGLSATERRGDALRILGQVLGLEMEHRQLSVSDQTIWSNIQAFWSNITDIPWSELRKYVLDPLNTEYTIQTPDFDPNSIMVWPFCGFRPTIPGVDYHVNYTLSDLDKEFVAKLYPKEKEEDLPIMTITVNVTEDNGYSAGGFATSTLRHEILVDWGDGNKDIFHPDRYDPHYTTHYYQSLGEYTIKVYGVVDALTSLYFLDYTVKSLDISMLTSLDYLYIQGTQLTRVDLSKNTALTSLWVYSSQLTSVDLSKNTALTSLWIHYNQLTSLDISKNTELKELNCYNNQLTSLDVSNNTELRSLDCCHNQLTSLDVSKNTALLTLSCDDNQLTSLDITNNTELHSLSFNNNQLTSLDVSKNTALDNLYCYNNQLNSLDVSQNAALYRLSCYNNPFMTDQDKVINLIEFLPNRTTSYSGSFSVLNETSWQWLNKYLTPKNWRLSSW